MGILSKSVDIFMTYKFLRILTQDWEDSKAFEFGIVDKDGKILRKRSSLKPGKEKDSYTLFHRMVWKIKRLLGKLPFGRSKLASYAAALWFIREEAQQSEKIEEKFKEYLIENGHVGFAELNQLITEEHDYSIDKIYLHVETKTPIELLRQVGVSLGMPIIEGRLRDSEKIIITTPDDFTEENNILNEEIVNTAGGGQIAGIGVGPNGEPPLRGKKKKSCRVGKFMNCDVFEVNSDSFHKSIRGKFPYHRYSKYVGEDFDGEEIRVYGRSNPGKGIILQNALTKEMIFLRRKKPV